MGFDSAFQRDAFQNDAFQVAPPTRGGVGEEPKHHKHKKADKLIGIYEFISVEIPKAEELIAVVDPFIDASDEEEIERRKEAKYVVDTLPAAKRINFEALAENALAMERFTRAVKLLSERIEALKRTRREEEEFLLLIMVLDN